MRQRISVYCAAIPTTSVEESIATDSKTHLIYAHRSFLTLRETSHKTGR